MENQIPVAPVVTPPAVVVLPKQSNFLVILLSVLLFISVSIAGFFAYQTQKLVKELTALKTEEKVVAVATTEPVSDPTANWKKFFNTKYSISLRYPSRFNKLNELLADEHYEDIGSFSDINEETLVFSVINNVDIYNGASSNNVAKREVMDSGYKYSINDTKIGYYSASITSFDDSNLGYVLVTIAHPTKNLFVVVRLPNTLSKVEFEEIISSFEFTD